MEYNDKKENLENFFQGLQTGELVEEFKNGAVEIPVHNKTKELYNKAINTWSAEIQLRQAQEESAELVVAISHFIRKGDHKSAIHLVEEVVDTQIMLEQIKVIMENNYGFSTYQTLYDEIRNNKLQRLEERLKND